MFTIDIVVFHYNKILRGMLFTPPSNKLKNKLTFAEQLRAVKQKDYTPEQLQPAAATFQLTLNILDLLIDNNPRISDELFIIKRSLTTWHEHTKQQSINKTRQIFNLRQNLIIRVKKEIGIVLQQIAYYLRNIVEEYNDQNIEIYYVKYLNALKKLDWGDAFINNEESITFANAQVQTQNGASMRGFRTHQSIDISSSTIDSPLKRCRQVNIQKYLQTKEQNLELQRKNDQLKHALMNREQQNRKLKLEIDKLSFEIDEHKDNQKKYLGEVDKLSKVLDKIKVQNEERERKEEMLKMTFGNAENKFEKLGNLKQQLHKELENVESQLEQEGQKQIEKEAESYFTTSFKVLEESRELPTVKKCRQQNQYDNLEEDELYRMLLLQALSLQDEMSSALDLKKSCRRQAKRFSHNPIVKSETF